MTVINAIDTPIATTLPVCFKPSPEALKVGSAVEGTLLGFELLSTVEIIVLGLKLSVVDVVLGLMLGEALGLVLSVVDTVLGLMLGEALISGSSLDSFSVGCAVTLNVVCFGALLGIPLG